MNFTTVVAYSCEFGHYVYGPAAVECLDGGVWNDTLPICKREYNMFDIIEHDNGMMNMFVCLKIRRL